MAAPEGSVLWRDIAGVSTAWETKPVTKNHPDPFPKPHHCHPQLMGWWELDSCLVGFSLGTGQAGLSPALIPWLGN